MTHWGEFPPNPPFLPPTFANPQIVKQSIPEATDGGANGLVVVGPDHTAIVEVQEAGPGGVIVGLGSTPEESSGTNIGETTIIITKTTWESGKTT